MYKRFIINIKNTKLHTVASYLTTNFIIYEKRIFYFGIKIVLEIFRLPDAIVKR